MLFRRSYKKVNFSKKMGESPRVKLTPGFHIDNLRILLNNGKHGVDLCFFRAKAVK